MALDTPGFQWSGRTAATDMSATQFRAINAAAGGTVAVPSAGGRIIGIRYNTPDAGKSVSIVSSGVVLWECGAAVTDAGNVQTDDAGRCIDLAAGIVQGVALDAGGAAGVFIPVLINPKFA